MRPVRAAPTSIRSPSRRSSAPGADKVALLRRADAAARAADPRIVRVEASLAEEWREVLVVTSDGRLARDRQPMIRFGVHAVAEEDGKRQGGRSGGAGRFGHGVLRCARDRAPRSTGARRRGWRLAMLHAVEAPAGPMEVVLGAGESGILLHEAVGHGLEADFNRKRTSNYTDQVGKPVASPLCTVVDDGTIGNARGSINVDDEGNPGRRNVLIENGILVGYMQDRISAKHFGTDAVGQRPARELPARAAAAHDQHLHAAPGQDDARGDHPFGEARRLRQALLRRAGQHLERRLRLLADRELPDRGRQAHRAAQGREPDRQRAGRAAQGDMLGNDFELSRGDLDLRQGRAVGAGRHRHADA